MVDFLIGLLESFNFPVLKQGSLADDEPYPSTFITFWVDNTADGNHYDNKPKCFYWYFEVNIYSDDPSTVENLSTKVRTLLKQKGFKQDGKGNDVVSDEKTHTGWGMNFIVKEEN